MRASYRFGNPSKIVVVVEFIRALEELIVSASSLNGKHNMIEICGEDRNILAI